MEFYSAGTHSQFQEAKFLCENAGGMIFEPRNEMITKAVINHFGLFDVWLGIHNNTDDGTFVFESDGTPVEWTNWANRKPSKRHERDETGEENCALVDEGEWYVRSCEDWSETVCFRYYKGESSSISMFNFIYLSWGISEKKIVKHW